MHIYITVYIYTRIDFHEIHQILSLLGARQRCVNLDQRCWSQCCGTGVLLFAAWLEAICPGSRHQFNVSMFQDNCGCEEVLWLPHRCGSFLWLGFPCPYCFSWTTLSSRQFWITMKSIFPNVVSFLTSIGIQPHSHQKLGLVLRCSKNDQLFGVHFLAIPVVPVSILVPRCLKSPYQRSQVVKGLCWLWLMHCSSKRWAWNRAKNGLDRRATWMAGGPKGAMDLDSRLLWEKEPAISKVIQSSSWICWGTASFCITLYTKLERMIENV